MNKSSGVLTCTRRIQFCAGHRVHGHENKCANLHGHNYVAYFEAIAGNDNTALDGIGRVIDFSVLRDRIGGWIDRHWDHGFILAKFDLPAIAALQQFNALESMVNDRSQKLFLMDDNPTAENMALFLLRVVCPEVLRDTGVVVRRVNLLETENCGAEASIE